MAKKLDLNKTVYELTQEYPELIEIMAGLGFTEIIKKPMLHSVGKIMTIPKGAKMKNISMMDVVTTLMGKGFELVGEMPDMSSAPQAGAEKTNVNNPPASRTEQNWRLYGRTSSVSLATSRHRRSCRRNRSS